MKNHNHNKFLKCGVLQELKTKVFYNKNKKYLFYMWDYNKNILFFNFREEKDINKSLYEQVKSLSIQLYYQHIDDYKNTLNLIYNSFEKVETKEQ